MQEVRKGIEGFENLYEITSTGKIFSLKRNKLLKRCGDEYGFHIVKLTKDSKAINHNVFELWKQAFPELDENEFKGARTIKYK